MISLRHAHPALRVGTYQILFAERQVYVFARQLDLEVAIVVVNAGTAPENISFAVQLGEDSHLPTQIAYGKSEILWELGAEHPILSLSIPERSGAILVSISSKP